MAEIQVLTIRSITGMNNSDPAVTIPEDQCVDAKNVEFFDSAIGERRNGSSGVDVPTAFSGDANIQVVSWLHRHLPSASVETDSELWALGQHLTSTNFSLQRKTSSWSTVTPDINIEVASNQGFKLSGASFHGKLFIAFPNTSATDRLFVWDGTQLRVTGIAEPSAPSVADTGAGTFSGTRYYRVRFTRQVNSTTVLRSEPSDSTTFSPSGAGASARITKPTTPGSPVYATHWEVEASVDNVNFYRIATVVVGTTTYDDSVNAYSTGYPNASGAVLSEDSGDYSLLHAAKFLIVDEDRLILAGAWEDSSKASRVLWTPVFGADGVGNDERWEADTDPFIDLDNYDGGPITGIARAVNGQIWVFKQSKIYVLVRTGQRDKSYNSYKVSDTVGALEGSIIQGVDGLGQPQIYFLDPKLGPCRTGGAKNVQSAGKDLLDTWATLNLDAAVVTRSLFYPKKQQVMWWIATDSSSYPDKVVVLHTMNTEDTRDGIRGGWAYWTGKIAEGYSTCLYADNINDNTTRTLDLVPLIGTTSGNGYILIGDDSSAVDDDGEAFSARILTKPTVLRNLLSKTGVKGAAILGEANANAELNVTVHRDFGLEEPRTTSIDFAPSASETEVIKQMRELTAAQIYVVQFEFEDVASPAGKWKLNRFDAKLSTEETA